MTKYLPCCCWLWLSRTGMKILRVGLAGHVNCGEANKCKVHRGRNTDWNKTGSLATWVTTRGYRTLNNDETLCFCVYQRMTYLNIWVIGLVDDITTRGSTGADLKDIKLTAVELLCHSEKINLLSRGERIKRDRKKNCWLHKCSERKASWFSYQWHRLACIPIANVDVCCFMCPSIFSYPLVHQPQQHQRKVSGCDGGLFLKHKMMKQYFPQWWKDSAVSFV